MATKKYKLNEEEQKLIDNFRAGVSETVEDEKVDEKEEKKMKDSTKSKLKKAGIAATVIGLLGAAGYGIYNTFFKDPSGLDDFDDDHDDVFEDESDEDDDDLFEEDKSE